MLGGSLGEFVESGWIKRIGDYLEWGRGFESGVYGLLILFFRYF